MPINYIKSQKSRAMKWALHCKDTRDWLARNLIEPVCQQRHGNHSNAVGDPDINTLPRHNYIFCGTKYHDVGVQWMILLIFVACASRFNLLYQILKLNSYENWEYTSSTRARNHFIQRQTYCCFACIILCITYHGSLASVSIYSECISWTALRKPVEMDVIITWLVWLSLWWFLQCMKNHV